MKFEYLVSRRRNIGEEKWKAHAFPLKPSRKSALLHAQQNVLPLKTRTSSYEDHCGNHIPKMFESHNCMTANPNSYESCCGIQVSKKFESYPCLKANANSYEDDGGIQDPKKFASCMKNSEFLLKVRNQPQESFFANGDEAHVNVVKQVDNEVVGTCGSKEKFLDQTKEYLVLESFSKTTKIHVNEIVKSKMQQSMTKEMSYETRDKFVGVEKKSIINTSDLKFVEKQKRTFANSGLKRKSLDETSEQWSSKSTSPYSCQTKKIKGNDHEFSELDVDDKVGIAEKVKEILRTFRMARKLVLHEKSKYKNCKENHRSKRIDQLTAEIVKRNIYFKIPPILGSFPGVEVGAEFQNRMELSVIGLHNPSQGGIDYIEKNGKFYATSIVATSWRGVDKDYSNVLEYLGEGGNPTSKDKNFTDQKLIRGNLSLKNSYEDRREVRVIRGYRETKWSKLETMYIYDGLYMVKGYSKEKGQYGTYEFKFQLERITGQPQLDIRKFKN